MTSESPQPYLSSFWLCDTPQEHCVCECVWVYMLIIRCHLTEQSIRNIYEVAAEESQLCDWRGNSVNGFIVWPAESWIVRSIYLCQLGVVYWRCKTRTVKPLSNKQITWVGCMCEHKCRHFFHTDFTWPAPQNRVWGAGMEARGIENLLFCAAGHRNGLKKNGETYAEHLQNISVLFVSYLHAAHPHTAAHVESELERNPTTQPHTLISDITHDWENTVRAISSANRRTKI